MGIKILKPAPGVKIRDPRTKDFLPDDGRRVEMSVYWNRRLQDGTVLAVEGHTVPKIEKFDKPAAEKTVTEKSAKRGSDL